MEPYKDAFVEFLVETGALRFGDFKLKSGRESPYFFNSGLFDTGDSIARLGYFYTCAMAGLSETPTVLFGPAYKGIPLCVATATCLTQRFGTNVAYCFDRKESKDHGEGGLLVGRVPKESDTICIVDDVITSGATKLEAIERLRSQTPAKVVSLVIALNRCEQDDEGGDPVAKLAERAGVEVRSIATIHDILRHVTESGNKAAANAIRAYQEQYGVEPLCQS
ncbi:orotate phosphoribosyltransferase [Candidatus Sumerlaeota bacterium]|nr:orotate phosphoribosyltransferase [Candidatus Sumerlaeota bacterium]